MRKIWILLAIAILVLVLGMREGFAVSGVVPAPDPVNQAMPYPRADIDALYARVPQATRDAVVQERVRLAEAEGTPEAPEQVEANLKILLGFVAAGLYRDLYSGASAPLTDAQIVDFLKDKFPPMTSEAVKTLMNDAAKILFSGKPIPGGAQTTAPPPPAGPGAGTGFVMPPQLDPGAGSGPVTPPVGPGAGTGPVTPPPAAPGTEGGTLPGAALPPGFGGGAQAPAPPSQTSKVPSNDIWGPPFSGLGAPRSFGGMGDGAGGGYPTIFGPPSDAGAYWSSLQQKNMVPSSGSLGSDALSGFLPFSRQPGDMDLVPDPYRVSQTYSPSSYSSKNEPVPVLTDFSAFQK
jgi:hypothetical protein